MTSAALVAEEPRQAARVAGLRYVDDSHPGIRRMPGDDGAVEYVGVDGNTVDDATTERIASLVIPPAWTDVWICANPNGHLQATGRDARGRKQYRYHPRWREVRDETKYHRMIAFGDVLPAIRARVAADLSGGGLPRERVLAAIVRLLDVTLIRVGNEEYARENKSYGLTTMRTRHVDVDGDSVRFDFRGKSGKRHVVDVRDRRVARVLQRCADLPGQELFQYLDADGERHGVDSDDVNQYIASVAGEGFTAKDFRTWAGTVLAACALREFGPYANQREAKRQVVEAIATVSRHLGNTPAVCRRCYVHPDVIDAHSDGSLLRLRLRARESDDSATPGLRDQEKAVLRLLRKRVGGRGRGGPSSVDRVA